MMTWTYLIWGAWLALFLILELLAVFHVAPWVPLSDMAWHLEKLSDVFRWVFFLGLSTLLVHIVSGWPN